MSSLLKQKKLNRVDLVLCLVTLICLLPWRSIDFRNPYIFCVADSISIGAVCGIIFRSLVARPIKSNLQLLAISCLLIASWYLLRHMGVYSAFKFEMYMYWLYFIPAGILAVLKACKKIDINKIKGVVLPVITILQAYILFALIETAKAGNSFFAHIYRSAERFAGYILIEIVISVYVYVLTDRYCKKQKADTKEEENNVLPKMRN